MLKPKAGAPCPATLIAVALLFLLQLPTTVHPAAAQGQAQSRNLGPNNIPVAGRFLQEWSKQGSEGASVYVNGYPITPERAEISLEDGKSYSTQWFERARYEAHPEKSAPYDVLLGRLGASLVEGRGAVDPSTKLARYASDAAFVGIDAPADADGKGKVWFRETRHSISGKILEYWNRYGGLSQFGFPLSEAFEEASPTDGKAYTVQYFERNRFELHLDKPAPYDVELGLLGVQQYGLQPIPADQLPIAPPKGVTSSKDTLVQISSQEPTNLVGFEDTTVVGGRFVDAITFQDALVHGDNKENYFPLAVWYVPTIENGGSYFVGMGDDRHLVTKYKLRPGIKWADGHELTSADAVFAYAYLLGDPNATSRGILKRLSSVENSDKYTVIYNWLSLNEAKAKLDQPGINRSDYAFLNLYIQNSAPVVDKGYFLVGSVLPQHVLSKVPASLLSKSDYARNPLGYGPYKVQEWNEQQYITLVANENYNLTAPPLIKKVISKFVVDVVSLRYGLVTNNFDAEAGDGILVPPDETPQIQAANGRVDSVPAASWEHLEPYFGYAPFQDKRVRQAMFQAINRGQIVDKIFKGAASLMNGPMPPSLYFSLDNPNFAREFPDLAAKYKLPKYPYDVAAANRLLDEAGWIKGSDGIRAKNGEKLSFEYGTTRNATRQGIQFLVSADLKQVGIDARPANYPQGFFDNNGPKATGKTKLAQFAYSQTSLNGFDSYSFDSLWSPENPGGSNQQQYKNEKVTVANRDFNLTIDRRKTAEAAAIAQVEMMNDVAVIPLVQRANIEIYKSSLQNRKVTNSQVSQWWNIVQWYFK